MGLGWAYSFMSTLAHRLNLTVGPTNTVVWELTLPFAPGLFTLECTHPAKREQPTAADDPACKKLSGEVLCGYLSGARCRLAYGPADVTATQRKEGSFPYHRLLDPPQRERAIE